MSSRALLVIDASVVGTAASSSLAGYDCMGTLFRAEQTFCLVMDHEGHMQGEYQRCMSPQGMVFLWWQHIISRQGYRTFVSGKLSRRDKEELLKASFEEKDMPYVGAAKRAGCKLIVHEDRGYCHAEDLIRNIAGVRCLHPPTLNGEVDAGALP